ncbi:hypothetical protein KW782_00855 [Candidatus Parcubacteria bacterium]|nr:hypothetical protein [Candidatus Parcubacteria bacterium]
MQVTSLHKDIDILQLMHGDSSLRSIYGAGCIENPKVMFVFMNPTARNISAHVHWKGLRAPWLGTKNVWNIFHELGLVSKDTYERIRNIKSEEWSENFCHSVYSELEKQKVFVTNLAKCTQLDARPLKDTIFRNYLELMLKEIALIKPKHIISFGNQVSSILLSKPISVSTYNGTKAEVLTIDGRNFNVYPTYYPVGQGRRNMPLAIKRIKGILK